MNEKYSALFTPWKIGNVEIKNRIVQPSMGGTSLFGWLEPCHFDKEAAYHILNRAQNNVGLVLPGMQCVRDTMGGRWLYQNKKMFKDLAEWLPEFHKTGSKLFVQLSAGMGRSMAINEIMVKMLQNKAFGAVGKPFLNVDYITASASATPNRWYPECKSRPLTVEEIHEMVDAFAKTAKLLQDAGVDGVEIHAVHEGYLLDQFTIANMNYRTDEYGGSFENRYRFAVEIVQAIKAVCGKDFPVALRYSVVSKTKGFGQGAVPGEEFVEFGRDMAESEKAIKYLEDAGYDMFDCDNGTYPYVTSSHPTAGGACIGAGIGPHMMQNIFGVVKAYSTRVGEGPFPTELHDETGEYLRNTAHEFGTVTGRPRRIGWLDTRAVRYAAALNSFDYLAITRLDILDGMEEIKVCTGYEYEGKEVEEYPADLKFLGKITPVYKTFKGWKEKISDIRDYNELPALCREYLEGISKLIGVPIGIVSVGPSREQTIVLKDVF